MRLGRHRNHAADCAGEVMEKPLYTWNVLTREGAHLYHREPARERGVFEERKFTDIVPGSIAELQLVPERHVPEAQLLPRVLVRANPTETIAKFWLHDVNASTGEHVSVKQVVSLTVKGTPVYLLIESTGQVTLSSTTDF